MKHVQDMNIITYNIELQATDNTRNHWVQLLSDVRDAYNACSSMVANTKAKLSIVTVHDLCYDTIRKQFPQLPSQAVIRVQKSVLAAFRSIRGNKHKNAKTPQMRHLSLQLDKRLYSNLSANGISIGNGTPQKREHCTFVLYDKIRELFSRYVPKDPTIHFVGGRLFLSVPFEVPSMPCKDDTAVGVDLGVRQLFVTSEGKSYTDKTYLKERRKLRYLKRCLQSKGTVSSRKHLRKVSMRERNMSKAQVEKACNVLLSSTSASILVLEDLSKIKSKTAKSAAGHGRKRHNNMLSQVPFFFFKERLTHKAPLVGKRVETVSPVFTSQIDSRSGKRDGDRRGRCYYCVDGVVLDADWNAAVNIARRANHPLSSIELPLSGRVRSITQSSETL